MVSRSQRLDLVQVKVAVKKKRAMSADRFEQDSMPYRVRVPWRNGDTEEKWTETCAWVIQQFGLPGDRFVYHATQDWMQFEFLYEQDAIFFSLRWS